MREGDPETPTGLAGRHEAKTTLSGGRVRQIGADTRRWERRMNGKSSQQINLAVCPSCRSPLLEEYYTDDDVWTAEIAFSDGDLGEPQLYDADWIKGDCREEVTGCAACGARLGLDDTTTETVDKTDAYQELARRAEQAEEEPWVAKTPTHTARCRCGNHRFTVELHRDRLFEALNLPYADDEGTGDFPQRAQLCTAGFEVQSIYCPACSRYVLLDDLLIEPTRGPFSELTKSY